jgi:hypothetical protein
MRLTEKQNEFINELLNTEKENASEIYVLHHPFGKKFYFAKIDEIKEKGVNVTFLKEINSRVFGSLRKQEIFTMEVIKDWGFFKLNRELLSV